ncbi:phosphate ABC transporter permease subunit PstC [Neoehrlichia mikurensis]|uniref:Phosphate transport system permease protein n=1 Tax=Neoehrlichia mikurensis TaxID=89586 RepID=A0A9Q9BX03_9RICK|nr:phosphate ABC transporter permease subunit PstC [Neoehrlichia mikurensis]QXK92187.1 phosphate ABC transporter permease subunit PstC [Neoehrlichia mikurensis]QXK92642.1 phosphate ABC transporter permease subunit PstC [Neoehrlichia mikurensis]QXK93880.1 phosphate ABC transporter permease subunit PstC [Neoehrlichia mikurensis]UTO55123.1 phosphate ABC transporter permease subunit PstC [Neoehrlichia mikurensis]UTO56043.1 phosphate ABC transporter permease subunit PstC [Neoehrlichia mikurensis]
MIIVIFLLLILLVGNCYKSRLLIEDKFLLTTIINAIFSFSISCVLYMQGFSIILSIATFIILVLIFTISHIDKNFKCLKLIMFLSTILSFITVVCIVACLMYKSKLFFSKVPLSEFLFGTIWNPDPEIIDNKLTGSFGILPLLGGTLLIVIVSMTIALPLGLLSAIYISEYASKRIRYTFNTALEILCGIPTVVYGYFAVVSLSPFIRTFAKLYNFNAHSENALVAGLSVGIMLLPFITLLLEHAIRSVPKILRYGSMALGATRAETIWHIIIPYALPSIVSSIMLSISRVIGETMIVLMAAGITANLTFNPLNSVTTVTVQIATILTGDQHFNSAQTSSAYALALILFIITWILNSIAIYITKKP